MGEEFDWSALLDALASALSDTGGDGWLVGGCLRDALLGLPVVDVDIALTGDVPAGGRAAGLTASAGGGAPGPRNYSADPAPGDC